MTPEAGQRFGPYEILDSLGGGGMGLVFRAWDERLRREVAVKLLHDSYKIPGMRERFLLEARAASGLNHPNICTVFDIGEQDGDPYLVMELLEGETLKERIARGALPVEQIVRYAEEIADALAVAHAKGVVHRDIKPANIFLVAMSNGKSQAKVLDFGLAKLELEVHGGWESRTLDLTLAGATVGTLAYMSPEQARGESLDMRSDLFSLGVVLYEMATQQVPFRGATSALMFAQLFDHDPEPVRNGNESVPRELEKLILKLLEKDRRARFQTARELHDALTKIDLETGQGWLRKGAGSAVPLVRANDPVTRHRLKRQKPSEEGEDPEALPVVDERRFTDSSADNMFIRPMRMLGSDAVGAERSVLHPMSAAAGEKRSSTVEGNTAIDRSTGGDASPAAGEKRIAPTTEDVLTVHRTEPLLVQSRTGAAQLNEVLDGLELNGSTVEESDVSKMAGASSSSSSSPPTKKITRAGVRIIVVAVLLVLAVGAFFLLRRTGALRPMALGPKDPLLLTVIENKTADKTLDGTVMQGLEIALQQSKSLNVFGGDAYLAGLRQVQADGGRQAAVSGQSVAQKVGAKAYVYGEIIGTGAAYTIIVDVLKTGSNDNAASLEEVASSREEIPAAIGRLAQALRAEVSEDGRAEARESVPFDQDATGNVDALHAFAVGEAALRNGRIEDALKAYQTSVTLDPKFTQAQIRLAWLYREEKAELASLDAAKLAKVAAVHASDKVKMLAQFCYEMNAVGDDTKAAATIRQFVTKYPHDVNGMKELARVLRAQGYLPESLLAAQEGGREDPFDAETYGEAEAALVELNRYDSALQLEALARHKRVMADAGALAAEYMSGKEGPAMEQVSATSIAAGSGASASAEISYAKLENYGRYLDSTGRLIASFELWRTSAGTAEKRPELSSTAASMLAQGALDRAFAESCTVALAMVDELRAMPKGPAASFNTGMAAALCGDQTYVEKLIAELQQEFPQNTTVVQYYLPELRAAADLGVNEPGTALQILTAVEQNNRTPLTPYLRGLARLALGQTALAVGDFQSVLGRRGAAWSIGGTLYPMAEIELARAYWIGRDKNDSVAAYRRFLVSWGEADRHQPLMAEALVRSK
jgi:serine/threonine protein kinase/tetratricopeptide (TPR) repeat protein